MDEKKKQNEKKLEEMQKRFEAELKKNPMVSDEAFMSEFGASDEDYKRGMTLPATEDKHRAKK